MTATDETPDIGPDPNMDFGGADPVEFAEDFYVALTIPFSPERMEVVAALARETGVDAIAMTQRLVDEALVARDRA